MDTLGWAAIIAGSLLLLIGALGLLRLPDFYCRMHAAGIIDTLGAGLLIIGMATQAGLTLVTVKLALIMLLVLFASPVATHALARAALHGQLRPLGEDDGEPPSTP